MTADIAPNTTAYSPRAKTRNKILFKCFLCHSHTPSVGEPKVLSTSDAHLEVALLSGSCFQFQGTVAARLQLWISTLPHTKTHTPKHTHTYIYDTYGRCHVRMGRLDV
jgi:hypothetical protein